MRTEPVAVINGLIAVVEAAIALAVAFGLDWTSAQIGLVMAFVITIGNVAKIVWVRGQVTPVSNPYDSEGHRLLPERTGC